MGQHIAYIRVSSISQSTERQLDGLEFDTVFEEKVSAKDTKRPKLKACMEYLRKGDTLHVHSIDRLARNLQDLLALISSLLDKGVTVEFHKEGLKFTGKNDHMQNLQLQIIGAVAQFERELIKERQREGIELAKRAGKYKKPKPKALTDKQVMDIMSRKASGESIASLAREYGVSRQTIYTSLNRADLNDS
ncbi:recombinase family protein [Halodesulfovibrio sp.]|uniref:recombinase family protein n=1 Tax=Halodesulfovibrio sp. TaxID=1912772 RepID=UPI0025FCA049|nr:recombinase family protein [Halodesulfovibrio sp.]MCT4534790.1 recombinase family protein [Halodesulfovibrio sp.]